MPHNTSAKTEATAAGRIDQIIGPVVDVKFDEAVPEIYTALRIAREGQEPLTLEVQQQLPGNVARTIAMSSTDGLVRGMPVENTGQPISVPVGTGTLGRMFNVLGEPIDGKPAAAGKATAPIHRAAPPLTEQSTKTEILETGIKVIEGRQSRSVRRCRGRKNRHYSGAD